MSGTTEEETMRRWSAVKAKRLSQLESMKVDELKCLCRDTGLKVSGKKAELVNRCSTELENKFRVSLNRFVSSAEKKKSLDSLTQMLEFMDKIKNNQLAEAIAGSEGNRRYAPAPPPPPATNQLFGQMGSAGGVQVAALGRDKFVPHQSSSFYERARGDLPLPTTNLADLRLNDYRGFTFRLNKYPLVTCAIWAPSCIRASMNNTNSAADLYNVSARLTRWDPFNIPYLLSPITNTPTGQFLSHTCTIIPNTFRVQPTTQQPSRPPSSVGVLKFEVPGGLRNKAGVVWLVRCLPIKVQEGKADVHLWPKNTSLFVNGAEVTNIKQRRQQSHDMTLWKGMSHPLNITGMVRSTSNNTLTILHNDPETYVLVLTPVLEKDPAAVSDRLRTAIERVSVERGKEEARGFVKQSSVVLLDSDDDDEEEEEEEGRVFSLQDPVAKVLITTPVTGKHCTHVQCFDLGFYLSLNAYPSARRWRCPCCEKFTSHEDLRKSELFLEFLKEYGKDVKGNEAQEVTQVEFKAQSGTWKLTKPKVATGKKRKAQTQGGTIDDAEEARLEKRLSLTPPPLISKMPQQEIIEIDLD
ncbi:hypothetical protein TL16_g09077 [Triparma laevis f. inornata]|uniref:Uncharacterized protein n=1 Tax=Triparma laevis f. inornata TaxID=1714386 RepID=A0A9W7B5J6_9STRA|nr:hypothetical protein TL16_g09077 [Triparma laevis f. inornata]